MFNTTDAAFRNLRKIGAIALVAVLSAPQLIQAQPPDRRGPYDPWQRHDPYQRLQQVDAGSFVMVRIDQSIDTDRGQGRVFTGVVDRDVWDDYRRLAIPAIPRGSRVELVVRTARDGDLILDLDSIIVGGQRYAVSATPNRIESGDRRGVDNDQAAAMIGGGAVLGTIIGAIAGGGKGAAIGAGVGAAAGAAGVITQGRHVRVPRGSVVTFRLERDLTLGVRDRGYSRDGLHYHRY